MVYEMMYGSGCKITKICQMHSLHSNYLNGIHLGTKLLLRPTPMFSCLPISVQQPGKQETLHSVAQDKTVQINISRQSIVNHQHEV